VYRKAGLHCYGPFTVNLSVGVNSYELSNAARDIVREIAAGLQTAHGAGFIHGDLKPANIPIDPKGKLHLIDFGLSTPLNEPAHDRMTGYGSVQYSDQWQLYGFCSNEVSVKQVYPLGVILYETVFRRRRIHAESAMLFAARSLIIDTLITRQSHPLRTGVDRPLSSLTDLALVIDHAMTSVKGRS
jgi:serine/threonine protein kinase